MKNNVKIYSRTQSSVSAGIDLRFDFYDKYYELPIDEYSKWLYEKIRKENYIVDTTKDGVVIIRCENSIHYYSVEGM